MQKVNPTFLLTLSDLCVNLSAGFFAATFIIPAFSEKSLSINIGILTVNLIFAIVFFVLAYKLKRIGGKND